MKRLARLLGEAWPVWVGFGVPLLGWYVLPFLAAGPKPIQYAGVALETFGLLVVAYELIEVREHLDSPGMLVVVRRWFANLGRVFAPSPRPADTPAAKAPEVASGFAETQAILDQIVSMASAIENLHRRLDMLQRMRDLEDHVHAESRQASTELKQLAAQVRALSLGNIGREFVGVCHIVFGIVMANLPDELHHLWLALGH